MVRVAAQLLSSHLAAIGHALAHIPRSAWHPVQMDCLLQRNAAAKQREVAAIGEFLGWHTHCCNCFADWHDSSKDFYTDASPAQVAPMQAFEADAHARWGPLGAAYADSARSYGVCGLSGASRLAR